MLVRERGGGGGGGEYMVGAARFLMVDGLNNLISVTGISVSSSKLGEQCLGPFLVGSEM